MDNEEKKFIEYFTDNIVEDIEDENYNGPYSKYVKDSMEMFRNKKKWDGKDDTPDDWDNPDEFSMPFTAFRDANKDTWQTIFMTIYNAFNKVAK